MRHQDIAKLIHDAYRRGAMFPDAAHGQLDLPNAYRAQFELLALREADGECAVGWKVGLTSQAMQAQQGVHEPCFGHLLASGQRESPAQLHFEEMIAPGFENELCLRLGHDLDGAAINFDQARAAIAGVAPALEIVEKRGVFGQDFPLAMAGNAQQRHFVVGEFSLLDADVDLAETTVCVEVNGVAQERATGAEVLGNPINAVVWLAGALNAHDHALRAGDLIMSGSFTKQYALARGDHVHTVFDPFGAVELRCD